VKYKKEIFNSTVEKITDLLNSFNEFISNKLKFKTTLKKIILNKTFKKRKLISEDIIKEIVNTSQKENSCLSIIKIYNQYEIIDKKNPIFSKEILRRFLKFNCGAN
jgi:hypothetical protein